MTLSIASASLWALLALSPQLESARVEGPQMSLDIDVLLLEAAPYREQIVPALDAFSERGDPALMVALLRRAIEGHPRRAPISGPYIWPPEVYAEQIEVLEGRQPVPGGVDGAGGNRSTELVQFARRVAADLARFFCVAHQPSFSNPQDLSRGPLPEYLYRHSAWIAERLTWQHPFDGVPLAVPLGEHSQELSPSEARRFQQELSRVPRPTGAGPLSDDFDNLTRLLAWAVEHASESLLVLSID